MRKKVYIYIYFLFILSFCVFSFSHNIYASDNTFSACLDGSLNLSVSCSEGDSVSFTCEDCNINTVKNGYSMIQVGSWVKYSESHSITFDCVGTHNLSLYINNELINTFNVYVYENHIWDEGQIKKDATCTKNGELEYKCNNCGNTKTETIPATGEHKWSEVSRTNATCSPGSIKYYCSQCYEYRTEEIPAKSEHKWEEITREEPTCYENGKIMYQCSACNNYKTEKIPASHQFVVDKKIEPTCTSGGWTEGKHCIACGCIEVAQEYIQPKGHIHTKVLKAVKPTYLSSGYTGDIYCNDCNQVVETGKTISKLKAKSPELTINKSSYKYKASKLKKKKISFKINGDQVGTEKVSYKLSPKAKKYIQVNSKGKVTIKKKCPKGTYKITVYVPKSRNGEFKSESKTITIKVK